MNRYCLLIALLLMLSGLAVAQQKEKPEKGVSNPRVDEGYWITHPTEVPDLVGPKAKKKATMPGKMEINDKDSSVVKVAKRAIDTHLEAIKAMEDRIKSNLFSGASAYAKTAEVDGIYDMVKLTSDTPETLLPWAEYRLQIRAELEESNVPRDREGNVSDRATLPILCAARYKAEIEVLTLREKIKK